MTKTILVTQTGQEKWWWKMPNDIPKIFHRSKKKSECSFKICSRVCCNFCCRVRRCVFRGVLSQPLSPCLLQCLLHTNLVSFRHKSMLPNSWVDIYQETSKFTKGLIFAGAIFGFDKLAFDEWVLVPLRPMQYISPTTEMLYARSTQFKEPSRASKIRFSIFKRFYGAKKKFEWKLCKKDSAGLNRVQGKQRPCCLHFLDTEGCTFANAAKGTKQNIKKQTKKYQNQNQNRRPSWILPVSRGYFCVGCGFSCSRVNGLPHYYWVFSMLC